MSLDENFIKTLIVTYRETICEWHLGIIPGLLQTEEYARQIHLDYQTVIPTAPGIIERRIRVRLQRQELLTSREPPLDLRVVLDEAVIPAQSGQQRPDV
jgi:hypothetical protein